MYTALSEQMDPTQLGVLMNDYYAAMFEPVSRHEGLVSDVVGDAMLAIWSAPSGDESSLRKKACLACLEIAAALERFNATNGRPPLYTRMGLHAGEMLLGTVGALHHYEYRAVGDMVNTANRVQGLNKYMDTQLLVSEKVVEGLDEFLTRPLGRFLLVGRASFLRVAELMGCKQDASSDQTWLAEIFADALLAYESQDWPRACHYFWKFSRHILRTVPPGFISSAASTSGTRRRQGHGIAAYAWKASDRRGPTQLRKLGRRVVVLMDSMNAPDTTP